MMWVEVIISLVHFNPTHKLRSTCVHLKDGCYDMHINGKNDVILHKITTVFIL